MIEVKWPMNWPQDDMEVCDWLEDLVKQYPKEFIFKYSNSSIYFTREEDAIAFKLRFGV